MHIIVGDFYKASLKSVHPSFFQHAACATRGKNTLQGSRVRPIWSQMRPKFVRVRLRFFLGRTGAPNVLASAASPLTERCCLYRYGLMLRYMTHSFWKAVPVFGFGSLLRAAPPPFTHTPAGSPATWRDTAPLVQTPDICLQF